MDHIVYLQLHQCLPLEIFFAVVACFYFVVLSNVFILILIVLTLRFLDKIVVLSSDNKGVGAFWTSVS